MVNHQVLYWDYLQLNNLLSLQEGLNDQPSVDEMHFIIVHQVFELWFKQIIAELRYVRDTMGTSRVNEESIPIVVHHIKRVNKILELASRHFDVMETLTPQEFLQIREKLGTASGFQSFQMREIELILGLDNEERKAYGHSDPTNYILDVSITSSMQEAVSARIKRAKKDKSVRSVIHEWLFRTPIQGSNPQDPDDEVIVNEFISQYLNKIRNQNQKIVENFVKGGSNRDEILNKVELTYKQAEGFLHANDVPEDARESVSRIRTAILFIESYHTLPLLAWPRLLLDVLAEMEELFVIFRFRHARMVERIIGRRVGTGGSSGVDYLDKTTKYRIFKELWAVRTILLSSSQLPSLQKSEFFGFSNIDSLNT
ncbi:MAG: tryptophan 2,3-dioxygenase family protein [Candidatus Kariarchaeaceae archaeon]|jgi:tryptophan 2,3-dioxygenase